ncbi:MAG: GAF domain-containing protein [Balneolaceae bacterium]|nr:MAG: GAF domain-containing protein [Balneolaceae bacterium]
MLNTKREEKALLEFKNLMQNLMLLLGKATGTQTGYLYWVNRSRRQFVLETTFTTLSNVMFQDRVPFQKSFLDRYKDLDVIVQLEVGKDVNENDLDHYFNMVPVRHLLLIPFRNNDETVAISVLETIEKLPLKEIKEILSAYKSSHINVLNTYLELVDLYDDQNKWADFDTSVDRFKTNMSAIEVLDVMLLEMQKLLPGGGAVVALRGMDTWVTVLRSGKEVPSPSIGLLVEERTMAHDALSKGEPVFSMHFNQNPKRVSSSEYQTEGASLAIPLMITERRHAVVVACNKNPLVFTESLKHQLKTLAKIASLTIEATLVRSAGQADLFVSEFGNFNAELLELSLKQLMNRADSPDEHAWFGLAGIENLSEIRSRYRLEDLKKLQKYMVKALNPARTGYKGFIGFHSDYVYSYLFVCRSERHHGEWIEKTMQDIKKRFELGDGKPVNIDVKFGSVNVMPGNADIPQIISDAKKALAFAMKDGVTVVDM